MKNIITLLTLTCVFNLYAQQQVPPQGINYQAVAIDNDGNEMVGVDLKGMPVAEKEIRVRFSILKDSETGILNYREQHLVTTDAYGLFNTVIGQGIEDATPNSFNQIDWGTGFHFLRVEIDVKGGTEYKDMGTQQLWSVPYALYSKYADAAGNGIEGVADNGDGTLTFTYLDGSTYTTSPLTGLTGPQGDTGPAGPAGPDGLSAYEVWLSEGNTGTEADFLVGITGPQGDQGLQGIQGIQGIQGDQGIQGVAGANGTNGLDGNGIASTVANGDGTFTFTYDDGSIFTTSDLTGPQGIQGIQGVAGANGTNGTSGLDGNGIASTFDNGDGTFTFTYDDGTTFTTSDLTGPQGATGAQGAQGIQGIQGIQGVAGANGINGTNGLDGNGIASTVDNGDGTFTLTYDDGTTFTTSDLTGPQGIQGIQGVAGANGINGTNGLDGNGIASTVDNGDGTFTFTYDDGTTFTTSDLTGPQGTTGAQGAQGIQGPQGPAGVNGINGTNGTNGLDANGIASTTDNGDGTFTFTYDDGSTFTTSDLTGPQGAQGVQGPVGANGANGTNGLDGNGIASTVDNGDGTFTFTYDDGTTFTTSDLAGPQGIQGIQGVAGANGTNGTNGLDGNGIASTVDNGDGTFTLTYDDGTTFTTSDLTGPQGSQGTQGIQGVAGANGSNGINGLDGNGIASTVDNGDGTFTLTYDDGTTFTTADLTGPQGATGAQGIQGPAGPTGATGPQGATGNGIASTVDNGDGTFTFTYDDGTTFTTSDLTGPQGATGAQGPAGANGTNGTNRQSIYNNSSSITTTETTVCTINVLANQMVHFSGIIVLETNARVRIRVKDASGNFVQNLRGRYQNVFALTSGATIVTTSNINTSSEISIFENSNSTYRITYDLFYLSPIDQTIDFRLIKDNSFTATLNGMTTMVF